MSRFVNPIIFVRNINVSKNFYQRIIGLSVVEEHDNFVRFETGFAIHETSSLTKTIWGDNSHNDSYLGQRNLLLYFEHDDIDSLFEEIAKEIVLIHPISTQDWGQRVFRFYDPDGHAVEIGEPQ